MVVIGLPICGKTLMILSIIRFMGINQVVYAYLKLLFIIYPNWPYTHLYAYCNNDQKLPLDVLEKCLPYCSGI